MNGITKFYRICDRLSLFALSLFTLECVLGSSGRWLSFGSISIRMMLFAVCFLVTLPNVFRQIRRLCRMPSVIFAVLFGFYLLIAAVIGWRRGNSVGFISSDITSFLTLALLPGFLATICTDRRVSHLTDILYYGSVALGILTTVLHFLFSFMSDAQINALNNWLGATSVGGLAFMDTGLLRIYMKSQIFLQVGLLIGLHKLWTKKGYVRWLLLAAEAVLAFACLMSFTRGFWLGFALSALFLLLLEPLHWKRYLSTVGITALLLAVLFALSWFSYGQPAAVQEVAGRFNPDLISGAVTLPSIPSGTSPTNPTEPEQTDPTEPDADISAVLMRQDSLRLLGENIRKNPVLGSGLGTNLDGLRDDGRVEYMYFDILMKTGFVGFLLFCAVFFLPTLQLLLCRIRRLQLGKPAQWDSPQMTGSILLAAYMGVAITSYVNPFLINPMGILLLLLLTAKAQRTKT